MNSMISRSDCNNERYGQLHSFRKIEYNFWTVRFLKKYQKIVINKPMILENQILSLDYKFFDSEIKKKQMPFWDQEANDFYDFLIA